MKLKTCRGFKKTFWCLFCYVSCKKTLTLQSILTQWKYWNMVILQLVWKKSVSLIEVFKKKMNRTVDLRFPIATFTIVVLSSAAKALTSLTNSSYWLVACSQLDSTCNSDYQTVEYPFFKTYVWDSTFKTTSLKSISYSDKAYWSILILDIFFFYIRTDLGKALYRSQKWQKVIMLRLISNISFIISWISLYK